jgi:hypothetical protein
VNINRDVAAVVKWTANRGSGEVDSNVAFSASNVCVSAGMPTASKKKRKKERNKKIQTHARPRHANAAEYSHDQIGTNDPHPYTANSDIGQATAMDSRKTKQKKTKKKTTMTHFRGITPLARFPTNPIHRPHHSTSTIQKVPSSQQTNKHTHKS